METVQARDVRALSPKVSLVAYTHDPYGLAVASARTCYAADFVFVGQLTPKGERTRTTLLEALPGQEKVLDEIGDPRTTGERRIELVEAVLRDVAEPDVQNAVQVFAQMATDRSPIDDRIAKSIYEAGHHTPFQHPTFVFGLEGVSRNVVESFFHQHTFYNSEQQSQRYVEMKHADVVMPASIASHDEAREVFEGAVRASWDAYHGLRDRLVASNLKVMSAIGKIKGQSEKQMRTEAEKKAQEMARYVIPVAAGTKLYHTVSGIVLLRYVRMANAQNCADEAREVVAQMIDAVRMVDPDFVTKIEEEAHAKDDLVEWELSTDAPVKPGMDLGGRTSKLVHATPHAANLVASAIREVTGSDLPDNEILPMVLDPGRNRVWNDTLNTWDHSPVLRALRHVHYTFHKRQSLSAYAQDQRHRMTPGTRPLLHRCLGPKPDVYTPDVVAGDAEAKALYDMVVETLWDAMHRLVQMGIPREDATYLLPNATNLYYTQTGDLLSFIHKWRLRLCFNAQKEIFDASLDELRQVQATHPELTQWLGPPCSFIAAAQPPELQDDVDACCPEGPRWCGVKVWKNFDAGSGKPKRPY